MCLMESKGTDVAAINVDGALLELDEPEERVNQRRLASSRTSNHTHCASHRRDGHEP